MKIKTIKLNVPPDVLAKQYLKHEFRKIFSDISDKEIWKRLDRSIDTFQKRDTNRNFWHLVAAISEGWKLKSIFRLLTNKGYRWDLVYFPIDKITFTSMSPVIDGYLERCNWNPLKFKEAWDKDKKMQEVILKTGFSEHQERDHFPIMLFQEGDKFKVFDGMRRTLLNIIKGRKEIKAWLGYHVEPQAKSSLSQDRAYFPLRIWRYSDTKDKELRSAIVRLGKEMVKIYKNGEDALKDVQKISPNKEVKEIIDDILKK